MYFRFREWKVQKVEGAGHERCRRRHGRSGRTERGGRVAEAGTIWKGSGGAERSGPQDSGGLRTSETRGGRGRRGIVLVLFVY